MSTTIQLTKVKDALSHARVGTYEKKTANNTQEALDLYIWNAQVSSAFLVPLHICEVVIRNAVSEVLEDIYGTDWGRSSGFETSLHSPKRGYNPRNDLQSSRNPPRVSTTGKLIPELNFAFWQSMFTSRHDHRLWNTYLMQALPNLDCTKSVPLLRENIHKELEEVRKFRNRIAHHEPIFKRNLTGDFQRIHRLVSFRCQETADWMSSHESVTSIIAKRPIP